MQELTKPKCIILNTPFMSIKKELAKQYIELSEHEKINGNLRTELDINTAFHYIKNLAFRTEATLLKQQSKDIDTKVIENTLKRLMFIQYQFSKLDVEIQSLKRQNQLLEEKLNYFKSQFK